MKARLRMGSPMLGGRIAWIGNMEEAGDLIVNRHKPSGLPG